MLMIKAIIRRTKVDAVLEALLEAGYPAVTRVPVYGRGKQRGLKIGEVTYDELPKEMLIFVIPDKDKDYVIKIIMNQSKSGKEGAYGDGKIFVYPIEEVYTISSGIKET